MKRSSTLVALAVATVAAASAPLWGQEAVPKWSVGMDVMVGGKIDALASVHLARTLLNYSVFSAAVDVMYGANVAGGDKVCILLPPPYVCDTRTFGSALVTSGVLTIGDRQGWPIPAIRLGIGHYHGKWRGSREGASSQPPEPSGMMLSGGIAGRIPGLRPHIEAEVSLRGLDRLDDKLTRTTALRFSYRF
jgi:hypothetical protein